ncbi:MAG: lysylphosphatidylglycerol synthase transmembrane domain-containing protein [Bacteroidota bacterium]
MGILIIWLFVRQLTPKQEQEIFASFAKANYWWLIPVLIVWFLSHLFRSIRWNMMLHPMGYSPKLHNTVMAVLIGYFANLALPRLGEVSRCTILTKYENIPFSKSFGTVVTERAFDVLVFIVLFFAILATQFDRIHNYVDQRVYKPLSEKFNIENLSFHLILFSLIFCIFLIVLYFVFRKKLLKWKLYIKIVEQVRHFFSGLKSIFKLKNPFLFLLYSALIWICYLLMTWFCFFCFADTSNLSLSPAFDVMVFGAVGFMVVQGGIGLYPVIVAETLTLFGVVETTGYALGWLNWSAQTLLFIILGIVSLLILPIINKNKV